MLTNGCFGSTVAAQAASPTCQSCLERDKCFEAVEAIRDDVLALIPKRMDRRGISSEDADATVAKVAKHLRKSLVPPKEKTTGSRTDALRVKFESLGIDIEQLRSRRNPFTEHDGPFFHMGAFVCEGVPFTPKDMAEAVNERGTSLKSSSVTSEVSRFLALLTEAGILKKEKRILCLA